MKAHLGATDHIAAHWHPRVSTQPEMELLASVTNRQRVTLDEGQLHSDAWLNFDVLRGQLQELRLVVPAGRRILDVSSSARLRGWQAEEQEGRQVVRVELLTPTDKNVEVEIHTEQPLTPGPVAVAGYEGDDMVWGVHALDVVRESGELAIAHGADLSLRVVDQQGLVRMEPAHLDEKLRDGAALAYRFYNPAFTLRVVSEPIQPRLLVDHRADLVLREEELRTESTLHYTIQRGGVFALQLQVPDGMTVQDVQSDALQAYRVDDGVLTATLAEKTEGDVSLVVNGFQNWESGAVAANLPLLEPRHVERETGLVRLFVPPGLEVVSNEENVVSAQSAAVPPGEMLQGIPLAATWQFTRRPVDIPVQMVRKPTRLSANVATDLQVGPQRTRVTTLLDFLVENSGVDTFRFEVPQAALETLVVEAVASSPASPAIRTRTPEEAQDGWVPWTIVLQRPVTGRQQFRITYDATPQLVAPVETATADATDQPPRATLPIQRAPRTATRRPNPLTATW